MRWRTTAPAPQAMLKKIRSERHGIIKFSGKFQISHIGLTIMQNFRYLRSCFSCLGGEQRSRKSSLHSHNRRTANINLIASVVIDFLDLFIMECISIALALADAIRQVLAAMKGKIIKSTDRASLLAPDTYIY